MVDQLLSTDADIAYPCMFHFLHLESRHTFLGRCRRGGSGRILSRRLLEHVDWMPYASGDTVGMEGSMDTQCGPHIRHSISVENAPILCAKTDAEHMWSWEHYRERMFVDDVDAEAFLGAHFPTMADTLLTGALV